MLYELEHLGITHGGRRILDVEHLTLEQGQTYSLQGPNGAGKSTLLGILAFLSVPHSGTVRFAGKAIQWTEHELRPLRQQVVLVEQHPIMFSCSVGDNVGYGLKIRGMKEPQRTARVRQALDLVGLGHLEHAYAPGLSGGETQRAAIARALACAPKVLLLDEPTASVDLENRVVIEQVVADMRDSGDMTIVLCTHNRSQARALCPRVLHMENGRLVAHGLSNAFAVTFRRQEGVMWCEVGNRLRFVCQEQTEGPGRIAIAPDAIHLTQALEAGLNRGTISRLELDGGLIAVMVDVGRPLVVQLPLRDFRELRLGVGDLVEVAIDASGVRAV